MPAAREPADSPRLLTWLRPGGGQRELWPNPDTNKAACLRPSIIHVKAVPFNGPSSSDLLGLGASLMIYLLGMKLSRDRVSLENTAEPVLPSSSSSSAATAFYK